MELIGNKRWPLMRLYTQLETYYRQLNEKYPAAGSAEDDDF